MEKTRLKISATTHLILLPPVGGVLLQLGHRLGQLVNLGFEVLEALAVGGTACLQLLHLQLRKMSKKLLNISNIREGFKKKTTLRTWVFG